MGRNINRVGEKYSSFQGYEMEIIEYINSQNVTIRFNDERGTVRKNVDFKRIKSGRVRNLYHRSTLGIGYIGEGDYKPKVDGKMCKQYRVWDCMLRRCYDPKNLRYENYKHVSVCEEWHNFQNFAKWYDENSVEGWQMDKDLLCYDCNLYSPETCCFIPPKVNILFSRNTQSIHNFAKGVSKKDGKYQTSISKFGKQVYLGFFDTEEEAHEVYMNAKSAYVKEVADTIRDKVGEQVYNAIINFDLARL